MKKLVSLFLALVMVLSLASVAIAAEPLTIQFWHTRGSGANYDTLKASVDAFNDTVGKEKGIVVEEVFIGNYDEIFAKTQLATQSGEQPVVAVSGNTYVGPLMDDALLADMMPLAQGSGFDVNNLMDPFLNIEGNKDGSLYSLPYVRSTPMLYYNKTMADEKGLVAPTTIEELVAFCKGLYEVDEATGEVMVYGFEMFNDFGYYNAAFLWQLGSQMIADDGLSSPALEDGTMLKILTDWHSWVEEGWCRAFDSTNAPDICKQMLFQGKLGAYLDSSGSLKNNLKNMTEGGYELGVVPFPTYDANNPVVEIGGGQITLVGKGNSDEQIAAGWEFLQFLMTDEQVALNAIGSGYLPITKSIATYETMTNFWAENPEYKVGYDQLTTGVCQETPFVVFLQEFTQNCWEACSLLIQDGSITPEEAVEMIKTNTAHLF